MPHDLEAGGRHQCNHHRDARRRFVTTELAAEMLTIRQKQVHALSESRCSEFRAKLDQWLAGRSDSWPARPPEDRSALLDAARQLVLRLPSQSEQYEATIALALHRSGKWQAFIEEDDLAASAGDGEIDSPSFCYQLDVHARTYRDAANRLEPKR